jgi:16S rRNA (guanine527-N7)-methyltransferase
LPPFSPEEVEKYDQYFALLKEWNEKINLVSRKSIDSSFSYHFADSLWIAHHAQAHLGNRKLRDLGSGAGFPGIVFGIRYPNTPVVLYEKMAKRRLFLQDAIDKLSLGNVQLQGALPEVRFGDVFTARAVFPPDELFPFMKRHYLPGGKLVTSWGGSKEVPEPPKPFVQVESLSYELPEDAGTRKLVVYEYVPRGTN